LPWLENKKDYTSSVINEHKIEICSLQEVILETDYPSEILSFKNYSIEVETNDYKAREAVCIKNGISRHELEGTNSNVIVIDLDLNKKYRLINLYKSPKIRNEIKNLKLEIKDLRSLNFSLS
jgi:hypothetical protein